MNINYERTTTGKMQFIVNQDRDEIFPLDITNLYYTSNIIEGKFYGLNLTMQLGDEMVFLGTFDTYEEVNAEIANIENTDLEIYCVSGFEEYMGDSKIPSYAYDY